MALGINSVQTNISALNGIAQIQTTKRQLGINQQQLSSGKRLVNAAVAPSDLAIATGFQSRIQGLDVAVQNTQDTVNLAQTADSSLANTQDALLRQRDIAVRASNEATLTDADRQNLNNEFQSVTAEVDRQAQTASFNTKQLRDGSYGTQVSQVSADAGANNQIAVALSDTTAGAGGLNTQGEAVDTTAGAQSAINQIDQALDAVAQERSNVGVTQRRLESAASDATSERINLDESRSRIEDTNVVKNAAENAQLQIKARLQSILQSHTQVSSSALGNLL